MYTNSIYFGLKVVPILVLWGQRRYYLGTWSLRARGLELNEYRNRIKKPWGFYLGSEDES